MVVWFGPTADSRKDRHTNSDGQVGVTWVWSSQTGGAEVRGQSFMAERVGVGTRALWNFGVTMAITMER
ncbi:hypothetical protein PAMP_018271 [Pampus punctatissimus]